MFDIDNHRAWEDFKALLLYREDRERRERGLLPLEAEFEREAALIAESIDPPQNYRREHLTAV